MKTDSIPHAVVAAFLAASQLAFSLPAGSAQPGQHGNKMAAELSDRDESSDPPKAERR